MVKEFSCIWNPFCYFTCCCVTLGTPFVTSLVAALHLEAARRPLGGLAAELHLEATWKALEGHLEVTWRPLGSTVVKVSKTIHGGPKIKPRRVQNRPKIAQGCPGAARSVPRASQERPRAAQEAPSWAQEAPKRLKYQNRLLQISTY